jgi:hypothetical protein
VQDLLMHHVQKNRVIYKGTAVCQMGEIVRVCKEKDRVWKNLMKTLPKTCRGNITLGVLIHQPINSHIGSSIKTQQPPTLDNN